MPIYNYGPSSGGGGNGLTSMPVGFIGEFAVNPDTDKYFQIGDAIDGYVLRADHPELEALGVYPLGTPFSPTVEFREDSTTPFPIKKFLAASSGGYMLIANPSALAGQTILAYESADGGNTWTTNAALTVSYDGSTNPIISCININGTEQFTIVHKDGTFYHYNAATSAIDYTGTIPSWNTDGIRFISWLEVLVPDIFEFPKIAVSNGTTQTVHLYSGAGVWSMDYSDGVSFAEMLSVTNVTIPGVGSNTIYNIAHMADGSIQKITGSSWSSGDTITTVSTDFTESIGYANANLGCTIVFGKGSSGDGVIASIFSFNSFQTSGPYAFTFTPDLSTTGTPLPNGDGVSDIVFVDSANWLYKLKEGDWYNGFSGQFFDFFYSPVGTQDQSDRASGIVNLQNTSVILSTGVGSNVAEFNYVIPPNDYIVIPPRPNYYIPYSYPFLKVKP